MWSKITLVLSLLPKIIAVVKLVDDILDPATDGAAKKQYALDIFRQLAVPEKVLPMVSEVIDVVVAVLNFFGLLGRSKTPDAPVAPENDLSVEAKTVRKSVEDRVAVTDDVFNAFLEGTAR